MNNVEINTAALFIIGKSDRRMINYSQPKDS